MKNLVTVVGKLVNSFHNSGEGRNGPYENIRFTLYFEEGKKKAYIPFILWDPQQSEIELLDINTGKDSLIEVSGYIRTFSDEVDGKKLSRIELVALKAEKYKGREAPVQNTKKTSLSEDADAIARSLSV